MDDKFFTQNYKKMYYEYKKYNKILEWNVIKNLYVNFVKVLG